MHRVGIAVEILGVAEDEGEVVALFIGRYDSCGTHWIDDTTYALLYLYGCVFEWSVVLRLVYWFDMRVFVTWTVRGVWNGFRQGVSRMALLHTSHFQELHSGDPFREPVQLRGAVALFCCRPHVTRNRRCQQLS